MPSTAAPATNQQVFQVKGVVHEVQAAKKKVQIAHEDIPGYMEAMTMMFDVKEARELDGLQPGDHVAFRMIVTDADGWIDQIKKLSSGPPPASTPPDPFRLIPAVEPLNVGDVLPDYAFTNHLGRSVRFRDFRGQAFAFTFIFTRCPFPNFCPRMSSHFASAYQRLKSMPDAPTNWHLFSITIDPEFDTPAALKLYARRYGTESTQWSYLTASLDKIMALGMQVTLQFWKDTNGLVNHNLRTVVIDAAGRVQKIIPENEWKPEELANELVKAARVAPPGRE